MLPAPFPVFALEYYSAKEKAFFSGKENFSCQWPHGHFVSSAQNLTVGEFPSQKLLPFHSQNTRLSRRRITPSSSVTRALTSGGGFCSCSTSPSLPKKFTKRHRQTEGEKTNSMSNPGTARGGFLEASMKASLHATTMGHLPTSFPKRC